ncbi:GspMb/PilO family protein [Pseudomonas asplenii]|uniref:GspMb/PilO family protein n=1 Tax=Pseudomonas asplenii TaxID=53407 RepID=UPI000377AF6E|nr:GspMb/PilO family protein [Pseudomonas fuscovaginae]
MPPNPRQWPSAERLQALLHWHLARTRDLLGTWGGLAALLIVTALVIRQGLIVPALADNDLRLEQARAGIAERPLDLHAREPRAVRHLPGTDSFEARLEPLLAILQGNGFAVLQTNFQYVSQTDEQTRRLALDIPLNGGYPALRKALDELVRQPALRIDSLSLQRQDIASAQLEIRLRLSLLAVLK